MPPDRLTALIVAAALGAARITPVIWLVAPLGGPRLPAAVRVGFALLLAAIASPLLVGGPNGAALAEISALRLAFLIAREVLVGLCLGLVGGAVFRAAEIAG